jgi:group I intron endonuclease
MSYGFNNKKCKRGDYMEKNWIVYIHVSPKGKKYIGITCRSKAEYRWGRNGIKYKNNPHFWNAIQKYGWDNFEHIIIATNLSDKDAKDMEIELINKYHTNLPQYGYNRTLGGDGTFGYKHKPESIQKMKDKEFSEETRKKLSDKAKLRTGVNNPFYGHRHSVEQLEHQSQKMAGKYAGKQNPRVRPVDQLDLQGNFIRRFWGAKEAKVLLGISNCHISQCCNGQRKTAGGYMWRYSKEGV